MTINEYLRQKFPHYDIIGTHAWCGSDDTDIRVKVLNDHAVIIVSYAGSSVTATCDFNLECDIVEWLEENLDDMLEELIYIA